MRTLAIDYGARRIGLALSDSGGRLASPYGVIEVTSSAAVIAQILKLIEADGVERIVIGLPLNMDGTMSPGAQTILIWGRKLHEMSSRPVIYVDERLSTFDAEQALIQRKKSGEKLTRKRKKQQLDAVAAATFLQDFLDGRLAPLEV